MSATENLAAVETVAGNDQRLAQQALEVMNDGVGHFVETCQRRGVPCNKEAIRVIYEAMTFGLVQSSPWLKAIMARDGAVIADPFKRPRSKPKFVRPSRLVQARQASRLTATR